MKDIFEIINERRDRRINIHGIVSELNTSPYKLDDINKLVSSILDNEDDIEFKIFEVKDDQADVYGISREIERFSATITAITFHIDVYMNAKLYNKIYSESEGLIDYFTIGAVKYETVEEAISGLSSRTGYDDVPEPYVTVNWDDISDIRRNPFVDPTLYDSFLQDSILYEFQEDNFFGMGSYPRSHDADGDILSFMEFSQDFRPTDMSDMFSNMVLSLDELPRPVIDRRDR